MVIFHSFVYVYQRENIPIVDGEINICSTEPPCQASPDVSSAPSWIAEGADKPPRWCWSTERFLKRAGAFYAGNGWEGSGTIDDYL